jgi:AraC-like DNA-binding protein
MTAHANSLTARAIAPNAAAAARMTLPAHDLRVLLDGLGRLGYDVDALLVSARLQHADFRNPDARVPCDAYGVVLDDARKGAAGRYVTESTLAIGKIAYLLGYSEPAQFHRAFKRWYGRTPEAFREARRPR